MTLEQFYAIRSESPDWMKNAMDIGLLTLQRRSDILNMRFDNIKNDSIYVIQQKTKKHDTGYLKIGISPQLSMVINRCRGNIPSPFLIHHRPTRGRRQVNQKEHWTQIATNTFTRTFAQARKATGLFEGWVKGTQPSFHEIRALGIKLYKDQNIDPQGLAGHASAQMTSNYDSGHDEIRWIEVEASLTLQN